MSQAVDDLLWVINGPSFVRDDKAARVQRLSEQKIDAAELEHFLQQRPVHRVGRYFENLLHYWLLHVRKVTIVGSGVQIRDGKRTVGELDFLYRDERGVLVHCEAAVKFFLHHPRANASHFPGPNASDDFERKTAKLFEQQLRLGSMHFPDIGRCEAFMRGVAFYRWGRTAPSELPARMAPDHERGGWLRAGELDLLAERSGLVGAVARKPGWLAPARDAALEPTIELAARLRRHFHSTRPHPVMISLRDEASAREVERAFVVSDKWPRTAQST